MTKQIDNLEDILVWLRTCPYELNISSMQTGHLHIKIDTTNIKTGKEITNELQSNNKT